MTCVKCSLHLQLTVQQWSEVLCYLGKAKHLEDLRLGLSYSSEVSQAVVLMQCVISDEMISFL